ncbi:hypothetical protein [Paracoccus aminophilus]|uniref:HNH nuclease domain-containing protein n=1 Tax=Paracoccus aminophilus JCM 7686 TaxID=1367847 RepID=S5XWL6_PARAH|nr:hypothetical protein [Paracoccus aminophilus]AGT09682.1 hypothetical protein JCM7686_2614 [Paracoccus aminophilus JCM 7686]
MTSHAPPTAATVYRLYGSSQHCGFPKCIERHIEFDDRTGKKISNSQVCHICARSENGARWDSSQTEAENRDDSNLILLCRKHHAWVDEPGADDIYTAQEMRRWKEAQELQGDNLLGPDDLIAIQSSNIEIIAENVNLGGIGGMAPGAGGGGGGAIGTNARGGAGGNGGSVFKNGILVDPSALERWDREFFGNLFDIPYGAGGAGEGALGESAVGGRGGDGGDIHFVEGSLPAGSFQIVVGRGSRLPGEFGQPTYIERLGEGEKVYLFGDLALGGMSGDSYFTDDVMAVQAEHLDSGFSVNCLALHDGAEIDRGLPTVNRIGWSWIDIRNFPFDLVVNAIALFSFKEQFEKQVGIFVSLVHDNFEKARIAVEVPQPEGSSLSVFCSFSIGAQVQGPGTWRLVAHSDGILLNQMWFHVRGV